MDFPAICILPGQSHLTSSINLPAATKPPAQAIKPRLMNFRKIFNKAIILSVFVLAGYLLARSMYYGSFIGTACAVIGIIAWTMFLYRLSELQSGNEERDWRNDINNLPSS